MDRGTGYTPDRSEYIDRVISAIDDLAIFPFVGMKREDLGLGFRTKGFEGRLSILFAVEEREVIIAGIYYGGRDVKLFR